MLRVSKSRSPQRAAQDQKRFWALEGVRSLPIAIQDTGQRVEFQSMGVDPHVSATIVDARRLDFAAWCIAAAVLFGGLLQWKKSTRQKCLFVIQACAFAILLPVLVDWWFDLRFGSSFDIVFIVVDMATFDISDYSSGTSCDYCIWRN